MMGTALWLLLGPKALALLVATECGARTFGRRSAGLRAAVRTAGLLALLLMPVLSAALPHSDVRVPLPAVASVATIPAEDASPERAVEVEQPGSVGTRSIPMPNVWIAIWLGGVSVLVARLLFDLWRVRDLARYASPLEIPLLDRLRGRLGIGGDVRTLETDALVVPVLSGVGPATILMPAEARVWPAAQVEMALLHELAHVRRRDYAAHVACEIVRALYWPNPLVWFVVDCAAADREQACDDEVLAAGAVPSAYAEQLVELARRLAPPSGALAMARVSPLKSRIRALLRRDLDRRRVRRSIRTAVAGSGLLAAAIAGCLDVVARATPSGSPPTVVRSISVPLPAPLIEDRRIHALLGSSVASVREAAVWAVVRVGSAGAGATLESLMLHEPAVHDRLMAATLLRELGQRGSVPALIAALDDRAYCVRWTAARSLRDLADPRAFDKLSALHRTDPNPDVRVMAAKALDAIGARSRAHRAGRPSRL